MARQIIKTCATCANEFTATCGVALYCSDQCHVMANVEKLPNGCWEWQSTFDKDGYGMVKLRGRRFLRAHRAAFSLFKKKSIDGLYVCHTCDNPKCVNPDHLFAGDAVDNKHDCMVKDRHVRGERMHWKAKLTAKDVLKIRADDRPNKAIAEAYSVTPESVQNIKRKATWKHV